MKIKYAHDTFDDLNFGDCFYFVHDINEEPIIYMKILDTSENGATIIKYVNLLTGLVHENLISKFVIKLNIETIINV